MSPRQSGALPLDAVGSGAVRARLDGGRPPRRRATRGRHGSASSLTAGIVAGDHAAGDAARDHIAAGDVAAPARGSAAACATSPRSYAVVATTITGRTAIAEPATGVAAARSSWPATTPADGRDLRTGDPHVVVDVPARRRETTATALPLGCPVTRSARHRSGPRPHARRAATRSSAGGVADASPTPTGRTWTRAIVQESIGSSPAGWRRVARRSASTTPRLGCSSPPAPAGTRRGRPSIYLTHPRPPGSGRDPSTASTRQRSSSRRRRARERPRSLASCACVPRDAGSAARQHVREHLTEAASCCPRRGRTALPAGSSTTRRPSVSARIAADTAPARRSCGWPPTRRRVPA